MEGRIETSVKPEKVWSSWEMAHERQTQAKLSAGQKGKDRFRYEVIEVQPGHSFSILWKTGFVKLLLTHSVSPMSRGSEIRYTVQFKGLFAILVQWFLGNKIQKNLELVLKAMVKQLEEKSKIESGNRRGL